MLGSLAKYAEASGLHPEPGFARKRVRWAIIVGEDGTYRGVQEMINRDFQKCPEMSQPELVAGGGRAPFLVSTLDVVTLFKREEGGAARASPSRRGRSQGSPRSAATPRDDAKLAAKRAFFLDLLSKARSVDPATDNVARMLGDTQLVEAINSELARQKGGPGDKVTFAVVGRDGAVRFLVDSEALQGWWRVHRRSLGRAEGEAMRCLLSGSLTVPEATHGKIFGLSRVGGQSAGDALISFDKESFASYGLEQAANAAVSPQMVAAYRGALNDLLQNHSHALLGAKVTHWYKGPVEDAEDPARMCLEGYEDPPGTESGAAQKRAHDLLAAIEEGRRPELADSTYFALTLSGAAGRVMVRDWMEGQFPDLLRDVSAWFADIAIVGIRGNRTAPLAKFETVLKSFLPLKKRGETLENWIKPAGPFRSGLWHAAIRREALSFKSLARLVVVQRAFTLSGELAEVVTPRPSRRRVEAVLGRPLGGDDPTPAIALASLYARLGLMKLYHIRKSGGAPMNTCLDRDCPHPAYHCGRLMAVLAYIQRSALGDVGAGVLDRYYGAASTTPKLVLGRLLKLSMAHVGALRKKIPDLAHWSENTKAEILCHVRPEDLPSALDLEEQSLFALGYYHQLAERGVDDTSANGEEQNV